jgi:hypothetical protein
VNQISIGEATLASLQQQITNLQNQFNDLHQFVNGKLNYFQNTINTLGGNVINLAKSIANLQISVNNLQTTVNNKVSIVSQMSGYQGLRVNGNLNGYLVVFKIQLLSNDNPQFFVFNWMQLNGLIARYTNDIQWPVSATPKMYYQSSTYIVAPGVYTISGQGYVYQMQFNFSAQTFHLYLESKVLADDKNFKKLGISPPNDKDDKITDEIVKEFGTVEVPALKGHSADAEKQGQESKDGIVKKSLDAPQKQKQQSPSSPLGIGANNDYVTFLVMAYY